MVRFDRKERQMDEIWAKLKASINSMTRGVAYTQRKQNSNTKLQQESERLRTIERNQRSVVADFY